MYNYPSDHNNREMVFSMHVPEVRTFGDYAQYLYEYAASMYKWTLPEYIPTFIPEYYLINRGHFGIFRDIDGTIVLASGSYAGAPTKYEVGGEYLGVTLNGKTYRGTIGEDVAVVWNNLALSSDRHTISFYAERYVESDKSILNVLRGARVNNLVTALDNTDANTLDNVVKSIEDGKVIVKVPPIHRQIDALDNGVERFKVLKLTDPKDTDKLQYLTRYHDDLLVNFLNEFGIDATNLNKAAQVTTDELHSHAAAVSAIVAERLECRRRSLDLVRSWGVDIDVVPNVARGAEQEQPGEQEQEQEVTDDVTEA